MNDILANSSVRHILHGKMSKQLIIVLKEKLICLFISGTKTFQPCFFRVVYHNINILSAQI